MEKIYKNRYGDIFTYTEDENQDILWQGNFEYCRISYPNDYTKAYDKYCKDHIENFYNGERMSLELFKKAVHEWDDETHTYHYPEYVKMVDSLKNEIDMVDPSGGPYMSRGMSLDSFGFKDYIVKDFNPIDTGYKIITEKCAYCNLAGGKHKMSCETRKIQINL
jgi:hypothetical protein